MKIALAQFNPTVGDFDGNSARILSLAERARQQGADLAVFSELCLCGYLPQDLLERPAFIDRNQVELKSLAAKLPIPAVVGYVGRVKNGSGKNIATKVGGYHDPSCDMCGTPHCEYGFHNGNSPRRRLFLVKTLSG